MKSCQGGGRWLYCLYDQNAHRERCLSTSTGCKSGIKPFAATSDWKNPSFENTGVPKPHIRIDFALAFEQSFAPGHWKCLRLPKG